MLITAHGFWLKGKPWEIVAHLHRLNKEYTYVREILQKYLH